MEGDDPIARLWVHAMRAELDAVTLRFEAQLKQHVAATAGARREELDALAQQLTAASARVAEGELRAGELSARLAEREQEIARMRGLHDEAAREIAALHAELDAARRSLGEMGARVSSLDAQFASERAFVGAIAAVAGTLLFDVAQLALGQTFEATPACYGAIKARKADALMAAIVRERGRSVTRYQLSREEREALGALAEASGCALIEVSPGARFASASMEKVATRSEPADEDHVLECLMPGVRLAESQGAVVHPKVVVATA
jgi:hypothetical protein